MEKYYDPHSYRASEHISAKEYFKKYSEICVFHHETDDSVENAISTEINLDAVDVDEMQSACSIDLLTLPNEPNDVPAEVPEQLFTSSKLSFTYPVTEDARKLNVIKCKEAIDKKKPPAISNSKRFLKVIVATNPTNPAIINDIRPGTNFIYTIIIYRPFEISYNNPKIRNSSEKLRFAFEMDALGTNTLAQVADKIECISNLGIYKDVESTKVDLTKLLDAKRFYPSQTMFIDGVFYNDLRSPDAVDYSANICKWAKEKSIGDFTTAEMDKVQLETLTPRFGYPYVFIHQGNCEHIFTFSDARLIQPGDCLLSKKYPRLMSMTRRMHVQCFLCSTFKATWIVFKYEGFQHEKVFLCTQCCDSYCYVDGKKAGEFKLYPFYEQMERS